MVLPPWVNCSVLRVASWIANLRRAFLAAVLLMGATVFWGLGLVPWSSPSGTGWETPLALELGGEEFECCLWVLHCLLEEFCVLEVLRHDSSAMFFGHVV